MLFDRKNKKINVLVTGAKGQLGSYIADRFNKLSFFKNSKFGHVFGIGKDVLDITNAEAVADFFNVNVINPSIKIDYVIHCAASTNTAAIEEDPFGHYAANCLGTKNIAESCAYNNIKMIFISSDYVFSEKSPIFGMKHQPFPVNQYGLQKLLAEQFVKEAYANKPKDCLIVRSSWMFGNSTNSFVEKFLKNVVSKYCEKKCKLEADEANPCKFPEKVEVGVVDDAYGIPTYVSSLVDLIEVCIEENRFGEVDFGNSRPQISRYDWAKIVWRCVCEAYVSESAKSNKNNLFFEELKDKIEIVPISSDALNLNMRHPGKLKSFTENANDDNIDMQCRTKMDTMEYVLHNINKFMDNIFVESQQDGIKQ